MKRALRKSALMAAGEEEPEEAVAIAGRPAHYLLKAAGVSGLF
jgi:hypothetical protein